MTGSLERELVRVARVTLRELSRTGLVPPGRPHAGPLLQRGEVTLRLLDGGRPRAIGRGARDDGPLYAALQEAVHAAFLAAEPPLATEAEADEVVLELEVSLGPPATAPLRIRG